MSVALQTKKTEASDLGSIKNRLGILSTDYKKFRPDAFFQATGLTGTQLAKILKVPRPLLYRDTLPLNKLREPIIQVVLATDLVFNLLENNLEETKRWLMSPNVQLAGATSIACAIREAGTPLGNAELYEITPVNSRSLWNLEELLI
jgi:hypothetical protein